MSVRPAVGQDRARILYAYIDELLTNFSLHPQKSIQFVMQRLWVICGRQHRCIADHVVQSLLATLGIGPRKQLHPLSENHASQLILLIMRYGLEERRARNFIERKGAAELFVALVEYVGDYVQDIMMDSMKSADFTENIFGKYFCTPTNGVEQCAFLVTLAHAVQMDMLRQVVNQAIISIVQEYQNVTPVCPLRSEFVLRLVNYYYLDYIPSLSPYAVARFVNNILHDPNRDWLEVRPMQTLIFSLLARQRKVSSFLPPERLFKQAADVFRNYEVDDLRRGLTTLREKALSIAISTQNTRNPLISKTSELVDYLRSLNDSKTITWSSSSVAAAVIAAMNLDMQMIDEDRRSAVEMMYTPFEYMKRFAEAVEQLKPDLNYVEVFEQLFEKSFSIKDSLSFVSLNYFFRFGKKTCSVDVLFDSSRDSITRLAFIIQALKFPDLFCFSSISNNCVDLSPLGYKCPNKSDAEVKNWICLDLTSALLEIANGNECFSVTQEVLAIFQSVCERIPEVLTTVLLSIPPPVTAVQARILRNLFSRLVSVEFPLMAEILNVGWSRCISEVQTLIVETLVDLVDLSDPGPTSEIAFLLKVGKDLRPADTSELLVSYCLSLAIILAEREVLDLNQWLQTEFEVFGASLCYSALYCMKNRAPPLNQKSSDSEAESSQTISFKAFKFLLEFCQEKKSVLDKSQRSTIKKLTTKLGTLQPQTTPEIVSKSIDSQNRMNPESTLPEDEDIEESEFQNLNVHKNEPVPEGKSICGSVSEERASMSSTDESVAVDRLERRIDDESVEITPSTSEDISYAETMEKTTRSSSVSSTGRAPLSGFGSMTDPRVAGPGRPTFPTNSTSNFGSLPPFMQQQSSINNSMNLASMFGPGFGGSQELNRSVPGGHPIGSFGGNSPTSQMARANVAQGPQRQNSSWSLPSGARPAGPPTPSQSIDFRGQFPPTASQPDFQPRSQQMAAAAASFGSMGLSPFVVEQDLSQMTFSDDVQEESNNYFEQIYNNNGLTVAELIEKLKRFKDSKNLRDQRVLCCVIKNLFEEFKFFPDYPDRELRLTAEVYGGILREGVISSLHLTTSVRKLVESIQSDPSTKLFTFGVVSLETAKSKLFHYPKVCCMIMGQENFKYIPARLQEVIRYGCKGELPPATESGRNTPPVPSWQNSQMQGAQLSSFQSPAVKQAPDGNSSKVHQYRTGNNVLSSTNVDILVKATESDGAEVAKPSEAVVDKVSFLFNNLSQSNLDDKKDEVLTLIREHGEPFIRWLAQYIVMKRVSIEQNFQPLYNCFIQAINHRSLDSHIRRETFRNIKILLQSDKRQAASNYSDRQLLKNLGLWLGSITIARSKPIVLKELDLKSLLLEAYYKGQQELLFVVPFIAKILLSCSKTTIFSSSCAWIRAILKVLAELHNEPDLKINLKFEIEVLCKELNEDLQLLPVEGILKDTEKLTKLPQQLKELKTLQRPDSLAASSPTPGQSRQVTDSLQTPGNETKPGTPAPEDNSSQAEVPTQNHFAYNDISTATYDGIVPHLQIKATLPLFQLHPQAKQVVRPAVTVAIKELIGPVSERAQKIAMTVTETLVRKDFSMDPDEKNIKMAAFHMMRAMTAGMAMITCRDPLYSTMYNVLSSSFTNNLRNTANTPEHQKMIEEASHAIVNDNVELATNFIVKSACEKAASEMEKKLEPSEIQKRIAARNENRVFTDEEAAQVQSLLPARIAVQPGPTPKDLLEIYAQFSSRICGFKPSVPEESAPDVVRFPAMESEKTCEMLICQINGIVKEIDSAMNSHKHPSNKAYQSVGYIRDLLSQFSMNPRDPQNVYNTISQCLEHFLHAFHVDPTTKNVADVEWPRRLRDLFLGIIRLLCNFIPVVEIARRITANIIQLNMDFKWNVEAVEVLLKHNLINTQVFDQYLGTTINGGSHLEATEFSQRLIRALSGGQLPKLQILKEAFPLTYEQLMKVHQIQQAVRPTVSGEGASGSHSPPLWEGDNREDGELSQKIVENVLRDWIGLCYTPVAQRNPQEALSQMVHTMHEHGCLSTDEKVSTFFKMCTEMCVDVTLRMLKQSDPNASYHQQTILRQRCYYTLDAYVKLVALMIRHSDGNQSQTKITILKKVLSIVTAVLHMDHEIRRLDFNPMPYHRIIISLFNELTGDPTSSLEPIMGSILEAFGQTLFVLQPRRCPGFAFAWLDIVGHRNVIGRLLGGPPDSPESVKMAAMYTQLIICHLKFLAPFLKNIHMPKSIALLYKGTLRVLLVILHDFPELLCEFHYVICDTIPPNCVQLRNLVLSAYPRNMRLPDPFALNFKEVDSIPDMAQEPKSNLNMATIIPDNVRLRLDEYLNTRSAVDFLTALPGLLQVSTTPGSKYNATVMNAVVLYVGMKAIESLHQRRMPINIQSIAHTAFMDIFQNLAVQLCTEGRYLLFNAIANQLRYPNAHTHYFSCVFLFLFHNSDCDAIQEQITRILFERLVALRPHPWGLLITFIELIKNPIYNFWKYEFTRCAPEIERLFQNVANTCAPPSKAPSETAKVN